jgi:hypothetical protein
MVGTAKSTLFISGKVKRHAPVRAELVDHTDHTLSVSKDDEFFAHDLNFDLWPIGVFDFVTGHNWDPIPSK